MRVLGCGPHAVLLEFADDAAVLPFTAALQEAIGAEVASTGPLGMVEEVVPAARTLLVRLAPAADQAAVASALRWIRPSPDARSSTDAQAAPDVTIDVTYDGEDLADVARMTGHSRRRVIRLHTGIVWTVAFCGFAPGFGYLRAPGDPLAVPRRDSPRTRVPVGAVGLAGPYSGVYPVASPGGWQLIGHTDVPLWDLDRTPPALLTPGTRVRFRAAR